MFSVDPGSGSSSPTGLAGIDIDSMSLLFTSAVWPDGASNRKIPKHLSRAITNMTKTEREELRKFKAMVRTKEICELTIDYLKNIGPVYFAIESFVMYGQSGETLQRFIGSLLTRVPDEIDVIEVGNTSMKKFASGSGKADKSQVAEGIKKHFAHCENSVKMIEGLITEQKWDEIDAVGIGLAAIAKLNNASKGEVSSGIKGKRKL